MLSESENLRASQTFSGIFRANMRIGRPEFWTASFTGALAGATFYALFYARAQIKEAHQEAQVQHLLALEQQYENEPIATYRKRLAEGRLKGEEEPDDLYRVLDFFETVGRLVDREYLDQSDVWDNFAYPVLVLNADAGKIIRDDQRDDPAEYVGFGSLAKKLERIEAEHHGALTQVSPDDVREFYREELSVGAGAPIRLRSRASRRSRK